MNDFLFYTMTKWIVFLFLLMSTLAEAQSDWKIRDPLDLGPIDFGDNKVLLYNGIGLGISLLLDKENDFKEVRWMTEVHFDYVKEYQRSPLSNLQEFRVRLGRKLRKYLSLGADLSLIRVSDSDILTYGLGSRISFSWYFLNSRNFQFYFDNGVGPNIFLEPFPYGGTHFNFTTFYGLTGAIRLKSGSYLLIGVRNIHISNAGIRGVERNPALDGLGWSIGLRK